MGDAALAEQSAGLLVADLEGGGLGSRLWPPAQLDLGGLGMVPKRVERLEPTGMIAPARRHHLLGGVQSIGE